MTTTEDREFELRIKQFEAVVSFTTAVEERLETVNMKPSTLAQLIGKSRSWISKVLRKKPNLTIFTAVQIADALGMDVALTLAPRSHVSAEAPVRESTFFEAAPTRRVLERHIRLVAVNEQVTPFPEVRDLAA